MGYSGFAAASGNFEASMLRGYPFFVFPERGGAASPLPEGKRSVARFAAKRRALAHTAQKRRAACRPTLEPPLCRGRAGGFAVGPALALALWRRLFCRETETKRRALAHTAQKRRAACRPTLEPPLCQGRAGGFAVGPALALALWRRLYLGRRKQSGVLFRIFSIFRKIALVSFLCCRAYFMVVLSPFLFVKSIYFGGISFG